MGKTLSLGTKLKYPITISKLLKQPGETIKKQESILQFKFTWMQKVGDPFGEEWEEEQTTIADWDSPADGTIKFWKVKEGQVLEKDQKFVEIEEDCPHSIQFAGLCGMCGKDMTEVSWASAGDDTARAQINMIHDQTALRVSEEEANRAEEDLQRRLLKHRKLSLVVDLDQTIIHACIEPTVGEWQRDPSNPNYEAVKEVKSFQLNDDGPRGLASGCWYYIKMRPGLKEFLNKIAELYELHVYTMGTRAYAMNIAKIVDPDKKLFGDRIISRDENGNITTKSLARLFPVDTKMVVIIDDRADVWPKNRPNLIKVVPYDFFLGIGDINSSFLPKREELPKMTPILKKKGSKEEMKSETPPDQSSNPEGKPTEEGQVAAEKDAEDDKGSKISALEELVLMGGGDQALQAAEQAKFLEKQLTERPLLHMQEKLDKEEDEEGSVDEEKQNGDAHEPHRHNLLKDDDIELMYLEKHLSQLHKAFYDEYDAALLNASGGRVAQLKPGHNKKVSMKQEAADLKIVPDIGEVMPRLKSRTLAGCTIVTSGLVPLQTDIMRYNTANTQFLHDALLSLQKKIIGINRVSMYRTEIGIQAASFGAKLSTRVSKNITHLVASTSSTRTNKVRQAAKFPHIKIVNQQWLLNSMSKWQKEDEEPYLVHIHDSDRKPRSYESSPNGSDSDEDPSDATSDEENENNIPQSQEEGREDDNVLPSDIEEGHSPIDDLKSFDWGTADDELKEFMGSDSEDGDYDSDTSTLSRESQKDKSPKRRFEEVSADDESDEESRLMKRQRRAVERKTALSTVLVKTPSSDGGSLPTPTEDDDDEQLNQLPIPDEENDFDETDLEALLEAEFAKSEEEEATGGD